MADKQEIRLKIKEMAILEILIFKNFYGGIRMPADPPPPLETRVFGARCSRLWRSYKHIWPAFGVVKLGVYDKSDKYSHPGPPSLTCKSELTDKGWGSRVGIFIRVISIW